MPDTGKVRDQWEVVGPNGERETIVRVAQWMDIDGQRVEGMPILRTIYGVEVRQLADGPPGRYEIRGIIYTPA